MLKKFGNRILILRMKRDEKEIKIGFLITSIVVIILFANLIYLNYKYLNSSKSPEVNTEASEIPKETAIPTKSEPIPTDILPTPIPLQNTTSQTNTQTKTTLKDYYVNLGSGSNRSTDWADVVGTYSTFDIAAYKNIKSVSFETTTNVPTSNGTVSVRLFNKTDGYAVWNSERTVQSEREGTLLISQNLNYDYGPKLYTVQMKSQMNVEANLIQARLHIVAE